MLLGKDRLIWPIWLLLKRYLTLPKRHLTSSKTFCWIRPWISLYKNSRHCFSLPGGHFLGINNRYRQSSRISQGQLRKYLSRCESATPMQYDLPELLHNLYLGWPDEIRGVPTPALFVGYYRQNEDNASETSHYHRCIFCNIGTPDGTYWN